MAYTRMATAGTARLHLGSWEHAVAWFQRAIEANHNYPRAYFNLAVALAHLVRLDEARSAVQPVLHSTRPLRFPAPAGTGRRGSDDPTYLARLPPISNACAKLESPNNNAARGLAAILVGTSACVSMDGTSENRPDGGFLPKQSPAQSPKAGLQDAAGRSSA
jgi:tetratricopeptide (TPR) repeat protein